MGYRVNSESREEKQWKETCQTDDYSKGLTFTERVRPDGETLFTPCSGIEKSQETSERREKDINYFL